MQRPDMNVRSAPSARNEGFALLISWYGRGDWNQAFGERGPACKCFWKKELAEGKIISCSCERVFASALVGLSWYDANGCLATGFLLFWELLRCAPPLRFTLPIRIVIFRVNGHWTEAAAGFKASA